MTAAHQSRARVTTAIRFSPELHARLVAAATDHGRPVNWLVNQAVADFLARLLPADQVVITRPATINLEDLP